jgi:aminopeptidase N
MEEASGQDLSVFFKQWLYSPGHLKVKGGWSYDDGRQILSVSLRQVQDDGSRLAMPIQIEIQTEAGQRIETVHLSEFSQTFDIDLATEPTSVVLDPNLWILMDSEFERR